MADLPQAVVNTAEFEDMKTSPYKDSLGRWTIGEGRCLETGPLTGTEFKYLLDAGLLSIMITSLGARHLTEEHIATVDNQLGHLWGAYRNLPDAAQTIMVEMAYQLGVTGLLEFTTFIQLVAAHRFADAANDARLHILWYKQTPVRAEALMKQLEAIV